MATKLAAAKEELKRQREKSEDEYAELEHDLKIKILQVSAAEKNMEIAVREITAQMGGGVGVESELRIQVRALEIKVRYPRRPPVFFIFINLVSFYCYIYEAS
jgi:hypothetical protein